jgi:hypothetical protein
MTDNRQNEIKELVEKSTNSYYIPNKPWLTESSKTLRTARRGYEAGMAELIEKLLKSGIKPEQIIKAYD